MQNSREEAKTDYRSAGPSRGAFQAPLLGDKVAIVTGAGSGIGRAISLMFVEAGATVLASDRNGGGLEETLKMASPGPGAISSFVADLSVDSDIERLVSESVSRYGRLTTLCSNAGVSIPGTATELSLEDFRTTYEVNVTAPFLAAKFAVPHMRASGGGSIINTGSANSLVAEKSLVGYTASKGGVLMLTKALALDYAADGIRANCLCPGFVDTPINLPHYERLGGIEAVRQGLEDWIPLGRGGEPHEIAGAAVWLASDLSTYVTGAAIAVDGGLTASL